MLSQRSQLSQAKILQVFANGLTITFESPDILERTGRRTLKNAFRCVEPKRDHLAALLLSATAAHVRAASIPIVNPSFESGTAGWTGSGVFDAFAPTPGMFIEPVPDGANVLFLGGASPGPGTASQALSATVQVNTPYRLDFSIGFRAEPHIEPTTYEVSLLPFKPGLNCDTPARGTFIPCSLTFTPSSADVGVPLAIQIVVGDANSGAVNQLAFDRFRLTAVPEPSQFVILMVALTSLLARSRRVSRVRRLAMNPRR
jgi:hypothetical protein